MPKGWQRGKVATKRLFQAPSKALERLSKGVLQGFSKSLAPLAVVTAIFCSAATAKTENPLHDVLSFCHDANTTAAIVVDNLSKVGGVIQSPDRHQEAIDAIGDGHSMDRASLSFPFGPDNILRMRRSAGLRISLEVTRKPSENSTSVTLLSSDQSSYVNGVDFVRLRTFECFAETRNTSGLRSLGDAVIGMTPKGLARNMFGIYFLYQSAGEDYGDARRYIILPQTAALFEPTSPITTIGLIVSPPQE